MDKVEQIGLHLFVFFDLGMLYWGVPKCCKNIDDGIMKIEGSA
jgi:hypothetical protein